MIDVCVKRVIDGDTLVANVTVEIEEFDIFVSKMLHVRLLGIDAPELKTGQAGVAARDRLKQLVEGKQIQLKTAGLDKYGRTLGTVVATVQTENGYGDEIINDLLLKEGFAVPYRG